MRDTVSVPDRSERRGERTKRGRTIASLPPPLPQNPYQRLLYAQLAKHSFVLLPPVKLRIGWLWRHRSDVGVLHFHWPQGYYRFDRGPAALQLLLSWVRLALFALRLATARALGYRVVWTVHQVLPHERRSAVGDAVAARVLGSASHALIVHDDKTRADVASVLGESALGRTTLIPHGSYEGTYQATRSRLEARRGLDIDADAFVLLCFGELRPYKQVPVLLKALQLIDRSNLVLIVAGPPRDFELERAVRRAAAADARILLRLEFVPDGSVADLFLASDVMVLPRGDGGSSGSLVLALSLATPVICADRAGYRELTANGEAGWYFRPDDPDSLAAAIEEAARAGPAELRQRRAAAGRKAATLSWSELAEQTAAVLLGEPAQSPGKAEVGPAAC